MCLAGRSPWSKCSWTDSARVIYCDGCQRPNGDPGHCIVPCIDGCSFSVALGVSSETVVVLNNVMGVTLQNMGWTGLVSVSTNYTEVTTLCGYCPTEIGICIGCSSSVNMIIKNCIHVPS